MQVWQWTFDPNSVGNDGIAFSANECARVTILAVAGGGRGDNGINEPNASVDPTRPAVKAVHSGGR